MLTVLLAAATLMPIQGQAIVCPVQGDPAAKSGPAIDYKGVRYRMCCAGCDKAFAKNPDSFVKADKAKGKVLGYGLFDPVSGMRIIEDESKATRDYEGVRYHFSSVANAETFSKDPAKFGTNPKKEALFCPVMKHGIADYNEAGGYVDYNDVRYYSCCGDCMAAMRKGMDKFAKNAEKYVKAPKALAYKE